MRNASVSVLIMNHRKRNTNNVVVGGHTIISKPAIEYLSITVSGILNFRKHLGYTCQKVATATLAKMVRNFGRPKHSERLLLLTEVERDLCEGKDLQTFKAENR